MNRIDLTEGLQFSQLVYGFMNTNQWNMNDQQLLKHIEILLEKGVTTFDHADIYGGYTCEAMFGKALALNPSLRDKMEIVTKCGIQLVTDNRQENYIKHYDSSENYIIDSVHKSLKNLNTENIDLLLFHRPDPLMDYEGMANAFHSLHKEGKVRYFGVSNFNIQQFKTLQEYLNLTLVTNQIEISVYQLDSFYDGNMDFCLEKKIHPMAWSPLAGGKIFNGEDEKSIRIQKKLSELSETTGFSTDQISLAWLLKHPAGILPIIGTGNQDRISSAIKSFDLELTRQQWFELFTASTGKKVP